MAQVFIPAELRFLTDGQATVVAEGKNVREVIQDLEARFPGVRDRLCQAGELRPGWCVAVGGSVSVLGLLQTIAADAEVHFLPAIGGG